MNEQLIVKNFGPIKDATVDFKKVTVFIGPTGGGKSTLAKLAAIFRDKESYLLIDDKFVEFEEKSPYKSYSILTYFNKKTALNYKISTGNVEYKDGSHLIRIDTNRVKTYRSPKFESIIDAERNIEDTLSRARELAKELNTDIDNIPELKKDYFITILKNNINTMRNALEEYNYKKGQSYEIANVLRINNVIYIPSERTFISSIEYSWPGMLRDNIGLPRNILEFANNFSLSRKDVPELDIPFLNAKYLHRNGQDLIKIPESETLFRLYETASGIQSVTPLLVLLEHLSRQKEQAQSFIIEEPELNLYPTAQQGLLNWLIEKCTTGDNDLTVTTHSPYILSHLNLLLYAYQVAEKYPDRIDEVVKIVPRESWINPQEFACYQVENGGVESLVNEELGLIDDNGLDNLSGDAADAFDNLIRLSKSVVLK